MVCNRPVFREKGWEEVRNDKFIPQQKKTGTDAEGGGAPEGAEAAEAAAAAAAAEAAEAIAEAAEGPIWENADRAARRAAGRVRDLALSNDFRWFVTLTLDKDKIDRYDVKKITRKLNVWLDNQVRRRGLQYVLVAERHKDGALHFHGLINDVPGLVPSGTWKIPGHKKPMKPRSEAQRREWAALGLLGGCHEVFNWDAWPLGFSTAIKLYGDYEAAVAYVCKYIRKQTNDPREGKIGGRWYYSGGGLRGPTVELVDLGLQEIASEAGLYRFQIPEAGLQFGIIRGNSKDTESEFTKAGL